MKCILIIGPMFSSKTTTLINYARKYKIAKKKTILVKYNMDVRYSVNDITSHDKENIETTYSISELLPVLNEADYKACEVILVDEIQFFHDALPFVKKACSDGKTVVCAGLSGDYNRKPFPVVSNLLCEADEIVHMKAICNKCCNDSAIFTKLIVQPASDDQSSQILIGGTNMYEARCRGCINSIHLSCMEFF